MSSTKWNEALRCNGPHWEYNIVLRIPVMFYHYYVQSWIFGHFRSNIGCAAYIFMLYGMHIRFVPTVKRKHGTSCLSPNLVLRDRMHHWNSAATNCIQHVEANISIPSKCCTRTSISTGSGCLRKGGETQSNVAPTQS